MTETAVGSEIVLIGAAIGFLAAIDSDWKDMRELGVLTYNSRGVQILNRLLFTAGVILCLFVDFPGRTEWAGKMFNTVMFPVLGFLIFCLAWALAYHALRLVIWVAEWCFE